LTGWRQAATSTALRRSHEMAAAADLLGELGIPARVTEASQLWLENISPASPQRANKRLAEFSPSDELR